MKITEHSLVVLFCLLSFFGKAQQIGYAEYFIDADPGLGNGIEIAFTPDSALNINLSIATNELTPGFHIVYFRALDTFGNWGLIHKNLFYVQDANPPRASTQLQSLEYFIDSDPGIGNGAFITISADSAVDIDEVIPLTGLSPGFHVVYFRTIDTADNLGLLQKQLFLIKLLPEAIQRDISALEYFIDVDPGVGNATPALIVPDSSIALALDLATNDFNPGFHMLYYRSQDSSGNWGLLERLLFQIKETPTTPSLPKIVSLEYFLEVDTPFHGSYEQNLIADSLIDTNKSFRTLSMESGKRIVQVRAQDENGVWGLLTPSDSFTVLECEWVYNTLDTGLGSFRFAVNCANPGDTINFDSTVFDQTLLLRLPRLDIHKDLTFMSDSTYNITLSNADISNTQLLVNIQGEVYMKGLHLVGKSGDSFLFKVEEGGSLELIEGTIDKISIETP
jgi:hypothetical protein